MRRLRFLRLGPYSLTGQLVVLAALALFVAQMVNAQLLLGERRAVRVAQAAGPAVARIADTIERLNAGRPLAGGWRDRPPTPSGSGGDNERWHSHGGGLHLVAANPIPLSFPRHPEVEAAIRRGLDEDKIKVGQIVTGLNPMPPVVLPLHRAHPERAAAMTRFSAELLIATELPGRGWLVQSVAWPRSEQLLVWQILAQTLVLYCIVLLPLLWAGYRISRPLKLLAQAARRFIPGDTAPPVALRGPDDVQAVIAAYNALSLRVNAMLEEKDRMLGAIGHDLRTPLAALRVRIESVEDEDDRNRMADTIDEMNRTIEDILSLARIGRPSEPPTEVDLAALIDAVVEDFRDLGADVRTEESNRLTMVLRPALMRRAIRNLIENAVKYAGSAEVQLAAMAKAVEIRVCDRGPGIPADKLALVFDPFTRLETSRNRETGGIGLGLALARAIAGDAGGDIRLANREGGGLVATIVLPR